MRTSHGEAVEDAAGFMLFMLDAPSGRLAGVKVPQHVLQNNLGDAGQQALALIAADNDRVHGQSRIERLLKHAEHPPCRAG